MVKIGAFAPNGRFWRSKRRLKFLLALLAPDISCGAFSKMPLNILKNVKYVTFQWNLKFFFQKFWCLKKLMHKNAIKMVWGVNFLGKIFVALYLALFGKKMAPRNSKHLATLQVCSPAAPVKCQSILILYNYLLPIFLESSLSFWKHSRGLSTISLSGKSHGNFFFKSFRNFGRYYIRSAQLFKKIKTYIFKGTQEIIRKVTFISKVIFFCLINEFIGSSFFCVLI